MRFNIITFFGIFTKYTDASAYFYAASRNLHLFDINLYFIIELKNRYPDDIFFIVLIHKVDLSNGIRVEKLK